MKQILSLVIILLVLVGVGGYHILAGQADDPRIREAEELFQKGEEAPLPALKQDAYNQSLSLYLQLKNESASWRGWGKLEYNIGNLFLRLHDDPRAILYYWRALELRPEDPNVWENLLVAHREAGLPLPEREKGGVPIPIFLRFPKPVILELFGFFTLLTFLLASLALWRPRKRWHRFKWGFAGMACLFALAAFGQRFLTSPEAVLVRPSFLRLEADDVSRPVIEEPLRAGMKVRILSQSGEGEWYETMTSDGTLGYLPGDRLTIL